VIGGTDARDQLGVDARWLGAILSGSGNQADWRAHVSARKPSQLPSEPPPAVVAALRNRLSGREQQAFGAVFDVRATAQRMDNAITEWMANSAATPARFQILMLLWAARGRGVPHKEIVAALGVTRATVSGLMAALERDGLVTSVVASDDRRNLLASLTPKGEVIVEKALETNRARLRTAFTALSSGELTTLTTLLERVRQGFSVSVDGAERRGGRRNGPSRRAGPDIQPERGGSSG
jgi:DNA-binding MarR family transcriptional regulator